MLPAGLKPATSALERPQTLALDRSATEIGFKTNADTLLDASKKVILENWQRCLVTRMRNESRSVTVADNIFGNVRSLRNLE